MKLNIFVLLCLDSCVVCIVLLSNSCYYSGSDKLTASWHEPVSMFYVLPEILDDIFSINTNHLMIDSVTIFVDFTIG